MTDLLHNQNNAAAGPVECLGLTFADDAARREHFLALLREQLQDPAFRQIEGFPIGSDEDILALSDPPYYTACPNPFIAEFIRLYGTPYDPAVPYHRDPFAVDVSVGKTDALYKAHSYHTKVPHLAIVPSILHYTKPGDLVLDGFCGTGMTGIAAQFCGTAPATYRQQLEQAWQKEGRDKPKWGMRRAILNDLGPAATFIAAGYNLAFDVNAFAKAAQRILNEVNTELGWMYETLHTDGKTMGRVNYTVWSEIFTCPDCSGEIVFVEEALDSETNRIEKSISCPHCSAESKKEKMDLCFETFQDPATQQIIRRPKRKAVLIDYSVGKETYKKKPDTADFVILERISAMPLPGNFPTTSLPDCQMTRVGRMKTTETKAIHHMFIPRAAQALAALWRKVTAEPDQRLRNALFFFVEQAIWTMSILNRFRPTGYSQVSQYLTGVYYVASQLSEINFDYVLSGKSRRLSSVFAINKTLSNHAIITTSNCANTYLADSCIDYIFTDPPFGENIYYADLNFLVESWHRVFTNGQPEAIIDRVRGKGLSEYQSLMRSCFAEYARMLKPGRWMTVVFSNSSNAIWRAIQEAMGTAGFVIADVRTLDKQQGSFKQVTSTAVKQDLVISAYKPTEALTERFQLGTASVENAWAFVREHLRNIPVFVGQGSKADVIVERTPQRLLDRMTAFHVQRGLVVPLSTNEFLDGLQRFLERDGMYFLPDQVVEYDRQRARISELRQFDLFVTDESSAIQWLNRILRDKPQTFQNLQPQFMREMQALAGYEKIPDLRELLELSFLQDSEDRWYVPDPNKAQELEQLRTKALLKEFAVYQAHTGRQLKEFRTEALRAGFKAAYDRRDYRTIVTVANKLPDAVLQEDEKLLMYYDVASLRVEEE